MTNSGDGCCAPGGDHVAGDHDVEFFGAWGNLRGMWL